MRLNNKEAGEYFFKHLSLIIIVVFLATASYACFVFYQYVYNEDKPEAVFKEVEIKKDIREKILDESEIREEKRGEIFSKEFRNIFEMPTAVTLPVFFFDNSTN